MKKYRQIIVEEGVLKKMSKVALAECEYTKARTP